MTTWKQLLGNDLKVVSLGLESFTNSLRHQGIVVTHVDWKPPAPSAELLERLDWKAINKANEKAVKRIIDSEPVLVDVARAIDVIPGMTPDTILHAGPPVTWDNMCGPVRGAVMGALMYEGKARTAEGAARLAASGKIQFDPCHHHSAVGPMAGVVSPSMYVWVVRNTTFRNTAFCTLNEGLGKVLRFGAFAPDVLKHLKWMERTLGPALSSALSGSSGINIRGLTAQALMMGDECHNRNVAATGLLIKELIPLLLGTDLTKRTLKVIIEFIASNPHFFLNLSMAACKASTDPIAGMKNCSLVSVMARNGTEIGIRVAGCSDEWFTAPAGQPKGLYFPGFSEADANPDLGDSTVSEIAGIGGFAMAAAPAIVQFVGGSPDDAIRFTREMYEICVGRHAHYKIPAMDFAGTPVGVDLRKVVDTGITPIINTGIAHKDPGVGQVGAGLLYAPMVMFEKALEKLAEKRG
jgi:hypothetical protein